MDERARDVQFFWVEESKGQLTRAKRKARTTRRKEFLGWGSRQLIEFLQTIGKDTGKQLSQHDVTDVINRYVADNNLFHPVKKKRIVCDEKLHALFGRKSVARIKIYDLLEAHFAENQESSESDDAFLYSSEEREEEKEEENRVSSHRQTKAPKSLKIKSCFAAIIPQNIKLVYLRRSLVQDLLKEDIATFENKVVGSFVRVKSDPNDYLQKNSHQLRQVAGVKKAFGTDGENIEINLKVSNCMKDVRICQLSDEYFSKEECQDLRDRINDGLLKRPTVVELKQKAQILHQDITKHWLVRELSLLQNLIDKANEKGWRRELYEFMERRHLLETPSEQSRLLDEIPQVIADEIEPEALVENTPDNINREDSVLPRSILKGASEIPIYSSAANEISSNSISARAEAGGLLQTFQEQQKQQEGIRESSEEPQPVNLENKGFEGVVKKVITTQVIDLSDDEENEKLNGGKQIIDDDPESLIWHYEDPQGDIQGPFSLMLLKRWSDADYFPPGFKIWRAGQSKVEATLLSDILHQKFPD